MDFIPITPNIGQPLRPIRNAPIRERTGLLTPAHCGGDFAYPRLLTPVHYGGDFAYPRLLTAVHYGANSHTHGYSRQFTMARLRIPTATHASSLWRRLRIPMATHASSLWASSHTHGYSRQFTMARLRIPTATHASSLWRRLRIPTATHASSFVYPLYLLYAIMTRIFD